MRIRTQRLPIGYRELEYIEGTGTQWMSLPTSLSCTYFEIVTVFSDANSEQCIIGNGPAGNDRWEIFTSTNGKYNIWKANTATIASTVNYSVKASLKYNYTTGKFTVNNTEEISRELSAQPAFLFAYNSNGYYCSRAKLFKAIFKSNDTVVLNFIPAERYSDGKPGLYDTVNDVFYVNQGTGEFIKGPYKDGYKVPDLIEEGTTNLFAGKTDFENKSYWTRSQVNSTVPTIDSNGDMVLYGGGVDGNHQSYIVPASPSYYPSLESNKPYTLSLLVKHSSTTAKFRMYFYEKASDGTNVKITSPAWVCNANQVGMWIRHTITLTTTATTVKMYPELNCQGSPTTDYVVIKSHSIQLEQKDHATPFVDGTRPDNTIFNFQIRDGLEYNYNQGVKNGNFTNGTTDWYATGGTIGIVDGALKLTTNTASQYFGNKVHTPNVSIINGHKYLISAMIRMSKTILGGIYIYKLIGVSDYMTFTANTWTELSKIKTATETNAATNLMIGIEGQTAIGDTLETKYVMLIDLTDWYGAGKEPSTVQEFKNDFNKTYYGYTPKSLRLTKSQINAEPFYGYNQLLNNPTLVLSWTTSQTNGQSIGTVNLVANNKYLIRCYQDKTMTSNTRNTLDVYLNGSYTYERPAENYNLNGGNRGWIYTPSESGTGYVQLWVHTPSVAVNYSDFQVINLTDWYGSGNEPTTYAEFQATFPHKYYQYLTKSYLNRNMINKLGKN